MTAQPLSPATPPRAAKFRRRAAASAFLLTVAGAAPLLTGCSFVFVSGPPPNHRSLPYVDCTSSRVAPVIDLMLAGVEGVGTFGALSSGGLHNDTDVIAPAAVALILAASGIFGLQRVTKCDEAKSELMSRALESTSPSPSPIYRPPADPWLAPPPAFGGSGALPAPLPAPEAPPAP